MQFSVIVNVVCFIIVVVTCVAITVSPVHAMHQGFFCDDESIRYPFSTDTVRVSVLAATCLLPAVLLVTVVEVSYGLRASMSCQVNRLKSKHCEEGSGSFITSGDTSGHSSGLKSGLGRTGIVVACLLHGNGLCYLLTEAFKLSFGRLRPYFLSACQPDVDVTSLANCSVMYFSSINCLNPDIHRVMDLRKSFVSGHASFAVFNLVFICLYLQLRIPRKTPRLLMSLLQTVALAYAVFVCASRWYDHAHHPRDLLGGTLLGLATVWFTVFKLCPSFVRHAPEEKTQAGRPIGMLPSVLPDSCGNDKPSKMLGSTSTQVKE